jgi:hypothetical protein
MRKKLPTITESADELQRRMKSETDGKQRQRLHAFSLVASGQARYRKDVALLLGVHRHSIAAWCDAYAQGGLPQALSDQVSAPPLHRRMTDAALTALQAKLTAPHGFAGYDHIRVWLAEVHQVVWSYSSIHALGRDKLHAQPKRPRPSHAKKVQKLCSSFNPHGPPSSPSSSQTAPQGARSRFSPKTKRGSAYCPACGGGLPPAADNLWSR